MSYTRNKFVNQFQETIDDHLFSSDCRDFEGCLTVHLPYEIKLNAKLIKLDNFIDVFLARHVSGTYAHHRKHQMLNCSIWFSAPSFCVRSFSQDYHPSKNSVQKTICCNSTSNAPDDGRMYPKYVELRIHQ